MRGIDNWARNYIYKNTTYWYVHEESMVSPVHSIRPFRGAYGTGHSAGGAKTTTSNVENVKSVQNYIS